MIELLRQAECWLFVPGDRPERFPKAIASGADFAIADLEDAVAPENKAEARKAVLTALEADVPLVVRINAADTAEFALDLAALTSTRCRPIGIIAAKAERTQDLHRIHDALDVPLIPLIESASGLLASDEMATAESVVRFAFGAVDFSLDIDADPQSTVLDFARSQLVIVSRAAKIASPIDSPTLQFHDLDEVEREVQRVRKLGLGAKLCIHPNQVTAVRNGFRPSETERDWAKTIVAASSQVSTGQINGVMYDRPVLEKAHRILRSL